MDRVVVHTLAGQLIKGLTRDFQPTRDRFHVEPVDPDQGTGAHEVVMAGLKAVFFVKDFVGDPSRAHGGLPHPDRTLPGRKVRVLFRDGETLVGITRGYQPGRIGFFVIPADPESNNECCFVLVSATRDVTLL